MPKAIIAIKYLLSLNNTLKEFLKLSFSKDCLIYLIFCFTIIFTSAAFGGFFGLFLRKIKKGIGKVHKIASIKIHDSILF